MSDAKETALSSSSLRLPGDADVAAARRQLQRRRCRAACSGDARAVDELAVDEVAARQLRRAWRGGVAGAQVAERGGVRAARGGGGNAAGAETRGAAAAAAADAGARPDRRRRSRSQTSDAGAEARRLAGAEIDATVEPIARHVGDEDVRAVADHLAPRQHDRCVVAERRAGREVDGRRGATARA